MQSCSQSGAFASPAVISIEAELAVLMCVGHHMPAAPHHICCWCVLRLVDNPVKMLVCVAYPATETTLCYGAETETAKDAAATQAAKLRAGMDLASAEMAALRGLLNPEP